MTNDGQVKSLSRIRRHANRLIDWNFPFWVTPFRGNFLDIFSRNWRNVAIIVHYLLIRRLDKPTSNYFRLLRSRNWKKKLSPKSLSSQHASSNLAHTSRLEQIALNRANQSEQERESLESRTRIKPILVWLAWTEKDSWSLFSWHKHASPIQSSFCWLLKRAISGSIQFRLSILHNLTTLWVAKT